MSSASDQFVVAASEQSRLAREAGGASLSGVSLPGMLRLGIVSAVTDGVYTIGVLGATGTTVDNIEGVHAWGGEFQPGARVVLGWVGDRPIPWILGGGGSSGSGGFGGVGIANRFFSS